jgi:hypothetical protein
MARKKSEKDFVYLSGNLSASTSNLSIAGNYEENQANKYEATAEL